MSTQHRVDRLGPAVARIHAADGRIVGTGFLITSDTVATCAHVVAQALGSDERAPAPPEAPVVVDFPLQDGGTTRRAVTVAWRPVGPDESGDMALLRLTEPTPATPVPLAGATDLWGHGFRLLGFPTQADQGVWTEGRLLARVGAGWVSMQVAEPGRHVSHGCSGAPVWDEQLGGVVGMTVAADSGARAGTAYLIPAASLLDLQPGLRRCPYRGLDAFREADADVFFGRDEEAERVTDAVERHPVVPVVGPSGSGKTSLVRAGVVPRLRDRGYTVSEVRPLAGTRPAAVLAGALVPVLEPGLGPIEEERRVTLLADDIDTGTVGVRALAARLLDACGERGHVIFVNQLEETVMADPAAARALLALLVEVARTRGERDRRIRIVATLRSASCDDLVDSATARVLSDRAQFIAPLDRANLLHAITGPAARVPGLAFEAGLPERIVADARDEPGCQPMVEFALAELWARCGGTTLTHDCYAQLGGVTGALSTHAESRVGDVIDEYGEEAVRRLFVQLSRPDDKGGFLRAPARLSSLPPDLRPVADALATRTRFVRVTVGPEGEPIVDLAHEALVRHWPWLREHLDESRDFRAWQERLRERLAQWEQAGHDRGGLLRGVALETALERREARPQDISEAERAFIDASLGHRRREVRRWRVVAAVVAVLSVIAGVLAVNSRSQAASLEEQVARQASQALAKEADLLAERFPSKALQMSQAAWRTARTPEARQALWNRYLAMRSVVEQEPYAWEGTLAQFNSSADGRTVVTRTDSGRITLWRGWTAGRFRHDDIQDLPACVTLLELSDDGRLLAAACGNGQVYVHSTEEADFPLRWTLPAKGSGSGHDGVVALDFSKDGTRLLVAGFSWGEDVNPTPKAAVWDTRTGAAVPVSPSALPADLEEISDAVLTANGRRIVALFAVLDSATEDGDVYGAAAQSRPLNKRGKNGPVIHDVSELTRDGAVVVDSDSTGMEEVLDPVTEAPLGPAVPSGDLDATGRYIVSPETETFFHPTTITSWDDGTVHHAVLPGRQGIGVVPAPGGRISVLLASGSDLLVAEVAEPSTSSPYHDPNAHQVLKHGDLHVVVNRDKRRLATADGHIAEVPAEPGVPLQGAILTSSGRYVVAWTGDEVWRYTTPHLEDGKRFALSSEAGMLTEVVPLGEDEVAVLSEGGLERFDTRSGKRLGKTLKACVPLETGDLCDMEARGKHPEEVAVHIGEELEIWSFRTGKRDFVLSTGNTVPSVQWRRVALSPDGTTAAVVSESDGVTLWDVDRKQKVGGLAGARVEEIRAYGRTALVASGAAGSSFLWYLEDPSDFVDLGISIHFPSHWWLDDTELTLRHSDRTLSFPVSPHTWMKDLCAVSDRDFLPRERRLPSGSVETPPCRP